LGSDKKTIWILNQYASHLETRHWELSRSFAEQGYNVAVITSSFHHGKREYMYDEKVKFVERLPGVTYVYVHSEPPYYNNGGKRILNMIDFCGKFRRARSKIAEQVGIPTFIIASSAPPFVWEAGYSTAKKFKAKFVVEFRDIWPLSLVDVQGVSPKHPLVKFFGVIEKRAYKRADAIVSTMPYAWKHVMEVADVPREKIFWMANGINVEGTRKCLESNAELPSDLDRYLDSHWCGVYVGSIAKCECIEFLLRGISKVNDPEVYFAIVGEGGEKESLQKLANELGLDRVRFFDAVDRTLIPKILQKAKLAIGAVHDIPIYRFGLSMNKLNDYLASGVPTILASNVDNVVKDAGHFAVPTGDEERFAEAVLKIKGLSNEEREELSRRAKEIIHQDYDYPEIGKKYLKMMEKL